MDSFEDTARSFRTEYEPTKRQRDEKKAELDLLQQKTKPLEEQMTPLISKINDNDLSEEERAGARNEFAAIQLNYIPLAEQVRILEGTIEELDIELRKMDKYLIPDNPTLN